MITSPPVSGRIWPTVKSWDPWTLFLETCRLEREGAHRIQAGQQRQLEELVRHAKHFVPYYQDVLKDVDVTHVELEELPILTRETLRSRSQEFTPRRLPSGMILSGDAHTSGTTGEPVRVQYTSAQRAWHAAHLLRSLDWANFNQNSTLAAIRHIDSMADREDAEQYLQGIQLLNWDPSLRGVVQTGPGYAMSIEQDPRVQYQWLKRVRPAYLVSHASNLCYLAELCRQHGPIDSLRGAMSICESITQSDMEDIEREMKLSVFDVYSCRELGYIASTCQCGFYHVYDDNVILEVLDDEDRPCGPGQTGRVVLTGLHTFATPLIRYEIGDVVTIAAEPPQVAEAVSPLCCWRVQGLSSLLSIQGRRLPLFRLLDGTRKDPLKLVSLVRQAARDEIAQFAIEQTESAEVVVHAVPTPELDVPRFTVAVTEAVWDFFGSNEIRVKTNLGRRLPLNAAGKALPVLSCRV